MKNKTDFTIDDSRMTQGVAIVCMIMGHLYWYKGTNVPGTPLIFIWLFFVILPFPCIVLCPVMAFITGLRVVRCRWVFITAKASGRY